MRHHEIVGVDAERTMVPTSYISYSRPAGDREPIDRLLESDVQPHDLYLRRAAYCRNFTGVHYSPEDFKSQLIDRPEGTKIVALLGDGVGIVSEGNAEYRLLASAPVGPYPQFFEGIAQNLGSFFAFSSVDVNPTRGSVKKGFLTVYPINIEALATALDTRSDPPATASELNDPASDWFIGPWFVEAGDRV